MISSPIPPGTAAGNSVSAQGGQTATCAEASDERVLPEPDFAPELPAAQPHRLPQDPQEVRQAGPQHTGQGHLQGGRVPGLLLDVPHGDGHDHTGGEDHDPGTGGGRPQPGHEQTARAATRNRAQALALGHIPSRAVLRHPAAQCGGGVHRVCRVAGRLQQPPPGAVAAGLAGGAGALCLVLWVCHQHVWLADGRSQQRPDIRV